MVTKGVKRVTLGVRVRVKVTLRVRVRVTLRVRVSIRARLPKLFPTLTL